jgi:hypothetical protein
MSNYYYYIIIVIIKLDLEIKQPRHIVVGERTRHILFGDGVGEVRGQVSRGQVMRGQVTRGQVTRGQAECVGKVTWMFVFFLFDFCT